MPAPGLSRSLALAAAALCLGLSAACLSAQTEPAQHAAHPIAWSRGPMQAKLGSYAEIKIPKGYLFADGDGARKFLELAHNPVSNQEVGVIVPQSEQETWAVIFEFDEVGYVKDDDKSSLDSKAILESIQKGTEEANDYRKQKGWAPFHVIGWHTPPYYDQSTHNLTWAVVGQEDNGASQDINYSVRELGRRGTMNVDLILDPKDVERTVPVFNSLMEGFRFNDGHRYADFIPGDKLAGYGLTALIAGGAGAVLVKTGLLAKFWKVIVTFVLAMWKLIAVLFAAIAARFRMLLRWFKSLFAKKQAPNQSESSPGD